MKDRSPFEAVGFVSYDPDTDTLHAHDPWSHAPLVDDNTPASLPAPLTSEPVRPCDIDEPRRQRVFRAALGHSILMDLDYGTTLGVRYEQRDIDGRLILGDTVGFMNMPEPVRLLMTEHVEQIVINDHDGSTATYTKVGW